MSTKDSRYAIYARTATGGPETLEAQVDGARALVRDVPVMVYRDMDVSGLTTERPALSALLFDMEAGKLDEVITRDWTRFGRTLAQVERVRAVADRSGCRLRLVEGAP